MREKLIKEAWRRTGNIREASDLELEGENKIFNETEELKYK